LVFFSFQVFLWSHAYLLHLRVTWWCQTRLAGDWGLGEHERWNWPLNTMNKIAQHSDGNQSTMLPNSSAAK
jgi:hypothetical protein